MWFKGGNRVLEGCHFSPLSLRGVCGVLFEIQELLALPHMHEYPPIHVHVQVYGVSTLSNLGTSTML